MMALGPLRFNCVTTVTKCRATAAPDGRRTLARVPKHGMHHADARLTEPAPCAECRFAERCKVERLACAAFSMYLHAEPAARWRLAPRAPTHTRYEALML